MAIFTEDPCSYSHSRPLMTPRTGSLTALSLSRRRSLAKATSDLVLTLVPVRCVLTTWSVFEGIAQNIIPGEDETKIAVKVCDCHVKPNSFSA